jgi:hypothetical protein
VIPAIADGRFHQQAMTAGDIYTIAGGGTAGLGDGAPATGAQLSGPADIALDGQGNLLIADPGHERVRMVAAQTGRFFGQAMTAGDIYTIAGHGGGGFSGDGGPATATGLYKPLRVTVGVAGNLVFCDERDNRIRVVAAATGTFYGQPMTAGDIYTIAGGGTGGLGDGGPATSGTLMQPGAVLVDTAGDVLICDTADKRIREVAGASAPPG